MSEPVAKEVGGEGSPKAAFARRLLRGCAVVGVFAALVLWANQDMARWGWLGVFPIMQQVFSDMGALLAGGEAVAAGVDPFLAPNPFEFYGRPHVYGPGWLTSGVLGLGVADAGWLGWMTVGCFLAGAVSLFSLRRRRDVVIAVVCLASPPVMLGLNRANNDLLIFIMALGGAWLAGRKEKVCGWAATVLLVVATLLKFYPAVMLIAVATLPGRLSSAAVKFGVAVVALGVAVVTQADLYIAALQVMPVSQTIHAYDARYATTLAWAVFKYYDSAMWWGFFAGGGAGLLAMWAGWKMWGGFLPTRGRWAFLLVGAAAAWAGCMAAGPSYAYRAVWLLPAVAWAARESAGDRRGRYAFIALVAGMLWLAYPKTVYGKRFDGGDQAAFAPMVNYAGAEQMMSLAVWLICFWMLAGWAWRRFKEDRAGA
jgi:hypothetical protein